MDISPRTKIPHDLQLLLERELHQGEKIKWAGQPKTWRILLKVGIFIIALALFGGWCVYFGIKWLYNTYPVPTRDPDQPFLWLACIPMFLIGFGMLYLSRLLLRRFTRSVCAITNKRAIIIFTPKKIESFPPYRLQSITKRLHRDGTGDLLFAKDVVFLRGQQRETDYGFCDIEEVDRVEGLLRSLADTAKTE